MPDRQETWGARAPLLLRNALIGSFLVAAIALLGYSVYSYRQEQASVRRELCLQAEFVAASTQASFDTIGKSLSLIAYTTGYSHVSTDYIAPFNGLRQQHPEILALFVFGVNGETVYTTLPINPASFAINKAPGIFDSFKADQRSLGTYTVGRTSVGTGTQLWRIPVRYIVRDAGGAPRLVLQASIKVSNQTSLWAKLPLMPHTVIGLIRDDLHYQARWPALDPASVYLPPSNYTALRQIAIKRLARGWFEGKAPLAANDRYGAYIRLPTLPMTAFVSVPGDTAWKAWRHHNQPLLLVCGLCFMIFFGFARLLLEREKRHHQTLWTMANIDKLTGLPSRNAAEAYLAQRIRQAETDQAGFAVCFIDLDKFKLINDSMGHEHGDEILKEAARRLKSAIREQDLLARMGGDEFIAAISCTDPTCAEQVAERLMRRMHTPFDVRGRQFTLSLSIGISFYKPGISASRLMREADLAMYAVKNAARNGYAFFTEAMDRKINAQVGLQQQLAQAVMRSEFRLVYQPQYNAGRQIVSAEALLRWQHPERGLLAPGAFIAEAEETGLILAIGQWVLEEACRQLQCWQAKGVDLRLAINVSARQFEDPAFVGRVQEAAARAGIAPASLELEVTESVLARDRESMKQRIDALADAGFSIALDDFGTGYSSLSYLQEFPIHTLKIDRVFVNPVATDAHRAELASTIIAMGHALKMHVVAEGVETEAQFNYLKKCHCDSFQGYYFARPMPVDELEEMLLPHPVTMA